MAARWIVMEALVGSVPCRPWSAECHDWIAGRRRWSAQWHEGGSPMGALMTAVGRTLAESFSAGGRLPTRFF